MPLKNFDDANYRFRSSSRPPERPRLDIDNRMPRQRTFPVVGASIPPSISKPLQPGHHLPVSNRPSQSAAWVAAQPSNVATPRLALVAPTPKLKKKRKIITKWRILFLIVSILVLLGGWVATKALSNTLKVFNGNVLGILSSTKLKGESDGRINVLLAGNSAGDPNHGGADLTDSIMIISLDVTHNTAFMLSVPRDLWVAIPGYGHAKINEAYVDGQNGSFSAPGYPNGGMGLLEEVIHNNFDIPIQYYALVNYNAFRDGVNAIGGITVNIQSTDPRGLYDPNIAKVDGGPLKLPNGPVHLDGQTALNLARARGDPCNCGRVEYGFPRSDFDRTEHQRMMLLALKNKVLTVGTLANPITLGNLFDSLGKNVKTDFNISEVRRAYDLSKSVDNSKITSASLIDANGKDLLASYQAPNGSSALIPAAGIDNFSQIQGFVRFLMTSDPIVRENANVVVLNGTDTLGLAAKVEASLTTKKINVAAIGDALAKTQATTVIDASGGKKPATLARLKQLYGAAVTATNPYSKTYTADFILVVGADQVKAAGTPIQ